MAANTYRYKQIRLTVNPVYPTWDARVLNWPRPATAARQKFHTPSGPYLFARTVQLQCVDPKSLDDSRLLEAARTGDESSFLNLYARYRIPLFRFAWRQTGSAPTAEDVVQECFVVLLNGAAFDRDLGTLRGYLFGVARNLVRARLRLAGREIDECEDAEGTADPLGDLILSERSQAVAAAVQALPPLQREAVVLFEYEQLSLDEIAHATGSEAGAVKARLHRARENLRRRLAPLFEVPAERNPL